jgi:bifunctional non-homologous end joining protein LigD
MEPIYPFEPVISDEIPTEEHWRYEIKWDGTRILTYHHSEGTKLFNRKQNERTMHYPELLRVLLQGGFRDPGWRGHRVGRERQAFFS